MRDVLRHGLDALRAELARDLECVGHLRAVAAEEVELADLVEDLDRQLERVSAAAVITLVGATGAGKSTLLNALVGEEIAVEGTTRPTTTAPVIFRPRDAEIGALLADLPGEPPRVVDYDPEGSGRWRGQILIDAPDVNSVAEEHRAVVGALAARSDVLVVVAHRQSIAELASVAFVDTFARRRALLAVLGRADELTAAACTELTGQLTELMRERWHVPDPRVVALSARRIRAGEIDAAWLELTRNLDELVIGERLGSIRRHNALGTAGRIAALFAALREGGLDQRLEALQRSLEEGLRGWQGRLESGLGERLELRRTDLEALLWNAVARRWDGPGGWTLRVGGLSALGLSTGAALARANPLLAAGAAAGALAADRARDGLRERSLSDPAGLLPPPGELRAAWRAELGEVRLLARELAAQGDGLGVPDAERLGKAALEAAGEAWQRLLNEDLPRAARSAIPAPLRLGIDLPVYGLAAWGAFLALRGLVRGPYVGLDFLVNAALVLLAWLFLARMGCRRLLSRRSSGLLDAVAAHGARALEEATREAAEPCLEAIAKQRRALANLVDLEGRWRGRLGGELSAGRGGGGADHEVDPAPKPV